MQSLFEILQDRSSNLALVIGNGINQFGNSKNMNSWENMLSDIRRQYFPDITSHVKKDISLIELYDLFELRQKRKNTNAHILNVFCSQLKKWLPDDHHRLIVRWAIENKIPILTTNFDTVLSDACSSELFHISRRRFTHHYPWSSYYGTRPIENLQTEFAIWHMHGMLKYRHSIRLGLTHYMGSVHRLRGWLYRGGNERLFESSLGLERWRGRDTWLNIFFGNDLLFFGIGLSEMEIFIRWCLIERKKFFYKFPINKRKGWYLYTNDMSHGKKFFLKTVGIEAVRMNSYSEIYSAPVWSS